MRNGVAWDYDIKDLEPFKHPRYNRQKTIEYLNKELENYKENHDE